MTFCANNLAFLIVTLIVAFGCNTKSARVDPKLDFGEMAKVVEVRDGNSKELRPVIRGVRVTVETSADNKASAESNSESSDSSGDRSQDRSTSVGVRTDVTFEISNESNETRSDEDDGIQGGQKRSKTKSNKEKKDDNDERDDVPVILGRPQPTKTTETNEITTWKPKVRPLGNSGDDSYESHMPANWFRNFPPAGIWTTERTDLRYGGYEIYPRNGKWILICCSWNKK